MARSTKDAWLNGPGDLRQEDVQVDYPNLGDTVRVRGLPAAVSAQVQSQMKLQTEGREQIAKIDLAEMEALQFAHGVVEPQFTLEEARVAANHMGPAYRKTIAAIDRLSGIDKEAIEQAEQRFPDSGAGSNGSGGGSSPTPAAVANGEDRVGG